MCYGHGEPGQNEGYSAGYGSRSKSTRLRTMSVSRSEKSPSSGRTDTRSRVRIGILTGMHGVRSGSESDSQYGSGSTYR